MEKPDTIKRHNPLIVAPKKTFAKLTARDRSAAAATAATPLGYNARWRP
jgi:hypothetical protein